MVPSSRSREPGSRRAIWRSFEPWARREIVAVTTASGLSSAGNSIHIVAASLLALHVTGSAASVPVIAVMAALPPLLLVNVVRLTVGRIGSRRILILVDLGAGLAALTLPISWMLGSVTIWEVYAQELLIAFFSAFYAPSSRSWSTSASRDEAQLVFVNSSLSGAMQVCSVVGWGLGGVAAALLTPVGAIAVNALSFLLSALLQLVGFRGRLRERDRAEEAPVRQALGPILRRVFAVGAAAPTGRALLTVSMIQRLQFSLLVAFLTLSIGMSEAAVGLANAAFSIGAVLGAVAVAGGAAGALARRHPASGVALMFLGLVLFTLTTGPVAAIATYGVVGFLGTSVVIVQSRFQDLHRDHSADAFAALGAAQALVNVIALSALTGLLTLLTVRTAFTAVAIVGGTLTVVFMIWPRPASGSGAGSAENAGAV